MENQNSLRRTLIKFPSEIAIIQSSLENGEYSKRGWSNGYDFSLPTKRSGFDSRSSHI